MSADPRLTNTALLTLAAYRLRERRQHAQADLPTVVWLDMDGLPEDPAEAGRSPSGIYLPRKCTSVEAWEHSPLIQGFRAKLRAPGGGDHGA